MSDVIHSQELKHTKTSRIKYWSVQWQKENIYLCSIESIGLDTAKSQSSAGLATDAPRTLFTSCIHASISSSSCDKFNHITTIQMIMTLKHVHQQHIFNLLSISITTSEVPLLPSSITWYRWRCAAGKVTVDRATHWPCVTDFVVYPPTGSKPM